MYACLSPHQQCARGLTVAGDGDRLGGPAGVYEKLRRSMMVGVCLDEIAHSAPQKTSQGGSSGKQSPGLRLGSTTVPTLSPSTYSEESTGINIST